ncbi:MAG: hypothetical protein C0421_09410 [Hyphomonas sp.]|uniref:putative bifunctional diguanylate cyclase/phosphodiesterase n=1 Tax=Hyphomonas sp. TaxID=87 RepID=UPI0025BC3E84|nr:GGDEF domain-containing phosphodiesterase [Hyphomonas sp.]MBA4339051.1 hypothetical protein [Hyphomonas sp.]
MVQFPKSTSTDLELLQRRMSREKLARKEAERILEQKSLELYNANAALIEAHAALEKQVRALKVERDRVLTMSRTDFLTQLPNRSALLDLIDERLAARRPQGEHVWLFLVNLQHFQFINAALGPRGGDAVLRGVAERLHAVASRYSAVAGRFSGTEFAILLEAGASGIEDLGNEILTLIEQPILLDGREVRVEVAMAAAGTNLAERTTNALRLAADSALVKCRAEKARGVYWFDEKLLAETERRQQLEILLRGAIQRREIEPWFQPIIHPRDPEAISLEVLARWPEQGCLIAPGEFLPLAEDMGQRVALDSWLVQQACIQALPWLRSGRVREISVNVSPRDLMAPGFAQEFAATVAATGFPLESLVVEVTEAVFIENLDLMREQLFELTRTGVRIALDDFGTGYSNLRSLVGLPFSKIKLDRSLIGEMETSDRVAMLVSTLVQWARASNLEIVAEGVETEMQSILLKSLGCSSLQGYLFGRAMSARNLEKRFEMLAGGASWAQAS